MHRKSFHSGCLGLVSVMSGSWPKKFYTTFLQRMFQRYSAPNICIAKWLQDAIWKTPKNSCPFNRFFWARGVRLMKSLTPHLGPEGEVVGIELCPNEPSIIGKHGVRPSVSSSGFALLHLLPLCVYVKFGNCLDWPFPEQPCEQHQISGADANCHWKFHAGQASKQKSFSITVLRWQLPLAPANQKHYTRYKAWRRNLALKPTGHFLLTCLQKQSGSPPMSCFLDRGWTIFSAVAHQRPQKLCSNFVNLCHVHVAFFSVLNELRFNEIMFCDCMVRDLMKSCFCKAPFKRASGLWNWRLAACTDKQGMAVGYFFAIGVVRWANYWCFAFYFTLDRWAGHWFFGSQHLVLRYLSPSLCFNLFWFNVWWTQNVTPNKFHQPNFFCNLFAVTSILHIRHQMPQFVSL